MVTDVLQEIESESAESMSQEEEILLELLNDDTEKKKTNKGVAKKKKIKLPNCFVRGKLK